MLSSTLGSFEDILSSTMDTMANRLAKALELRGMTAADLIKSTGLSRAGVYFLLDGTTTPEKVRASTLDDICKAMKLSLNWLLNGKGPMDAQTRAEAATSEWGDILAFSQAVGLGKGAEAQEYAETHKLKFRSDSLERKRLKPSALAVMYGDGDSMEPRIKKGDAVMFDTGDTRPRDDTVFVIQWKGEYYAKRCMILDENVYFKADNPNGDHAWNKPKAMNAKRDPIIIIGRVRWIGSWED